MLTLLDALERHLPAGVVWTRPAGGYTLWLTLPEPAAAESVITADLTASGVRVAPGRLFFDAAPERAHIRLSIACVDETSIDKGCRRIGEVLRRR